MRDFYLAEGAAAYYMSGSEGQNDKLTMMDDIVKVIVDAVSIPLWVSNNSEIVTASLGIAGQPSIKFNLHILVV